MTVFELGAIGEFVSSLLVLITLIYLTLQIKETRKVIIAQTYQARADMQQEAFLRMTENDELLAIHIKLSPSGGAIPTAENYQKLNPIESRRLYYFSLSTQIRLDNLAFQYLHGNITEEDVAPFVEIIREAIPIWKVQGITPMPAIQKLLNQHKSPKTNV